MRSMDLWYYKKQKVRGKREETNNLATLFLGMFQNSVGLWIIGEISVSDFLMSRSEDLP